MAGRERVGGCVAALRGRSAGLCAESSVLRAELVHARTPRAYGGLRATGRAADVKVGRAPQLLCFSAPESYKLVATSLSLVATSLSVQTVRGALPNSRRENATANLHGATLPRFKRHVWSSRSLHGRDGAIIA